MWVGMVWGMETTTNTKFIIEVRRNDTQRRPRYFQSAPKKGYYRIRLVSVPAPAKQFATLEEAQTVCATLTDLYDLRFTVAEKVA